MGRSRSQIFHRPGLVLAPWLECPDGVRVGTLAPPGRDARAGPLRVLSLGAGVQSSYLFAFQGRDELPRFAASSICELPSASLGANLYTMKDYGSDPLGDGTFRMVPSGDIVDFDERNRRLNRGRAPHEPRPGVLGRSWEQIAMMQGGLDTLDITRRPKPKRPRSNPSGGSAVVCFYREGRGGRRGKLVDRVNMTGLPAGSLGVADEQALVRQAYVGLQYQRLYGRSASPAVMDKHFPNARANARFGFIQDGPLVWGYEIKRGR